jgi:serine/threonine-protein kinase RsbW
VIQEPVRVRLDLESHPENVVLVRAAVTGFAEAAGLDAELLADLKTAVSEACNNVVLHAYEHDAGPMLVEIEGVQDGINVTVIDQGRGITRIVGGEDRMGLGLAVISALADRAEFRTPATGGTEVRMCFSREIAVGKGDPEAPWPGENYAELTGDVIAWFSPVQVVRFVLGGIFRALAASSHFSVERFSDLYAVNDAIAEYAELAADGGLSVAISSSTRELTMTGGPFVPPVVGAEDGTVVTSARAAELENLKQALAEVVDTLSTEPRDGQELLHVVLVDAVHDSA